MPTYEYRCKECNTRTSRVLTIAQYESSPSLPCPCGSFFLRVYTTFAARFPMPDHFNNALGRYVTGKRDFVNGLKQASDERTEATGIVHNFQPVDLRDPALNVTEEGLYDDNRTRYDRGQPTVDIPS